MTTQVSRVLLTLRSQAGYAETSSHFPSQEVDAGSAQAVAAFTRIVVDTARSDILTMQAIICVFIIVNARGLPKWLHMAFKQFYTSLGYIFVFIINYVPCSARVRPSLSGHLCRAVHSCVHSYFLIQLHQ